MLLLRDAICDAETKHAVNRHSKGTAAEVIVMQYGQAVTGGKLPQSLARSIKVTVVVNWGRWLVRCPWCMSAQHASRRDHRFFCVECGNAPAKGKWIAVVWPKDADAIEETLLKRPDPKTRNWEPPETVAGLLAENVAHRVSKIEVA